MLTQYPNTRKIIEGLDNIDLMVVQDIFMTTTARYADFVLPVTTLFETRNLLAGIRSRYMQLMEQAIEPLFESRSGAAEAASMATSPTARLGCPMGAASSSTSAGGPPDPAAAAAEVAVPEAKSFRSAGLEALGDQGAFPRRHTCCLSR